MFSIHYSKYLGTPYVSYRENTQLWGAFKNTTYDIHGWIMNWSHFGHFCCCLGDRLSKGKYKQNIGTVGHVLGKKNFSMTALRIGSHITCILFKSLPFASWFEGTSCQPSATDWQSSKWLLTGFSRASNRNQDNSSQMTLDWSGWLQGHPLGKRDILEPATSSWGHSRQSFSMKLFLCRDRFFSGRYLTFVPRSGPPPLF